MNKILGFLSIITMLFLVSCEEQEEQVVDLTLRNHYFEPQKIYVSANKNIKIRLNNFDPTIEEFESSDLNREKIIPSGKAININLGFLKPGIYKFHGEFHSDTAQGELVVEENNDNTNKKR